MFDVAERSIEIIIGQLHHLVPAPQLVNTLMPVTPASSKPSNCGVHIGSMSAPDTAVSYHGCKRNLKGGVLISVLRVRINREALHKVRKTLKGSFPKL